MTPSAGSKAVKIQNSKPNGTQGNAPICGIKWAITAIKKQIAPNTNNKVIIRLFIPNQRDH